jgi:hypothetical protein
LSKGINDFQLPGIEVGLQLKEKPAKAGGCRNLTGLQRGLKGLPFNVYIVKIIGQL